MPTIATLGAASARAFGLFGSTAVTDPYFFYNTLLLPGNGTNGAQNNTFLDSSTNNFTITRNGNTTQGTFTPYGSNWSNYLTGSSYLTWSGTSIGTSAFTFECWFFYTGTAFPPGGQDGASFIGPASASSGALNLNIVNSTTVSFDRYGVSADNFTVPTLVANTWYHIAFVRNASNVETVFLNGARSSTGTVTSSYNYTGTTNAVGFTGGAVSRYFPGYISNARLVTGSAVYDPTQTTITVPTAPLTAVSGTQLLTCQSNRFIDNSSNAFAITVNGSPSVQRFSPFNPSAPYAAGTIGGSGYFDGSGDYLSVADNAALEVGSGSFTLECWVYYIGPNATNGSNIVSKAETSSFGPYAIGLNPSNAKIQGLSWYSGGDWNIKLESINAITPYAWTHIAYVRNGSTFTLYVNGVSQATATDSSALANNAQALIIGQTNFASTSFPGYITNVRLVVGSAVYTTGFTPPTAPLTAIANTQLLTNFTNGGIIDNAMMNDLETVGNAQISTTQSKFGGSSINLSGGANWLLMASSQNFAMGTGDFTVEAWVYPTSSLSAAYNVVFSVNATGGLYFGNTTTGFGLRASSVGDICVTTAPSVNTWTHIAVTRSGTTVRLFYNGVQQNSATSSQNFVVGTGNMGSDGSGSNNWPGYIDDFRITKGIARYTANFTPPTAAFPLS